MTRPLTTIILLCAFAFAPTVRAQHHSSASHSHSSKSTTHSSKSKSKNSGGTVHVRGYYRKDGTYVHGYDRAAPGIGINNSPESTTAMSGPREPQPYRKNYLAEGREPHSSVSVDRHGKIKRSKAAKDAFERQKPCPSTGKTSGACPGYVVDHVRPLECGGADALTNMQWQTTADAKAKDKTEGSCRQ
jgi:hypothetical protein